MPWKGVTVDEQRKDFIRDHELRWYSVTELAERFCVSRKTAHKWISRFREGGFNGLAERSRAPHRSPNETPPEIRQALLEQKGKHPAWGARKLLKILQSKHPDWTMPSEITANRLFDSHGLVHKRRRLRRLHPGCPKHSASEPNDIWAADYKGQFRLKNGSYCFPLTISDLHSRLLLGCQGHHAVSLEQTRRYFEHLFREYGLPNRIRTDNGIPFPSNALARLSQLSVWWISLGIYPELIEPGHPEQNGIHERMHRTLKAEATIPPEYSMNAQQDRFNRFRQEFDTVRPHQAIEMRTPAELYRPSDRKMPATIEAYDYPDHYLVRRVSRAGTIRAPTHQFFVATPLREQYVGLEEIADGVYDLFFCFYHIGRYDHRTKTLHPVISSVNVGPRRVDAPWKRVTDV